MTLTRHPTRSFDITTRDRGSFRLQPSASVIGKVSLSKASTHTRLSTRHINTSQQCIWCDNSGRYYSECQEFHEVIRRGHIYLNKCNRITSQALIVAAFLSLLLSFIIEQFIYITNTLLHIFILHERIMSIQDDQSTNSSGRLLFSPLSVPRILLPSRPVFIVQF
jgi:hypothetical protein